MNRRNLFKSASALAFLCGSVSVSSAVAKTRSIAHPEVPDFVEPKSDREVLSLNKGWRFFEGDFAFPDLRTGDEAYAAAKTGNAIGAAAVNFDDSEWSSVTLPHDFVSFQPLDQTANQGQGYRKRGIAWYRTVVEFDESDNGKHIELQFEGVATNATVWFNGVVVNHNWSGYNSFYIDVTALATYGAALNSLAVRVDAKAAESWWYEGGGIYRNVWIVKRNPIHIMTDGVYAHPVKADDGWTIPVEVTVNSAASEKRTVDIISELWDGRALISSAKTALGVPPFGQSVGMLRLAHNAPKLWSIEAPNLYHVVTRVESDGKTIDSLTTRCGFRTQEFDADKGFFLNDKHVKIKGVCNHQDHAGVGVAVPEGIIEYRLQRLKDLGCNAIRCSHNAQDRVLLDICDRLGFLVLDETRIFNAAPDYIAQLKWMVRRDRNHPSIYLWSVFNEEPLQSTEVGYNIAERMREAVRELDLTRPVTGAMNFGHFTEINAAQVMDVVSFNYQQGNYDKFHSQHPTIPIMSSEDTSAFMIRGEYTTDKEKHLVASYDDDASPWGGTHRQAWKNIAERDFIAGCYVWTGFDYHGEPTPYEWPTNSSTFGIMDLCGFEKTAFYIHQAQWIEDKPVLSLVPHWNWAGKEGQPIRVMVCSNLDEVELTLNGKTFGRQKVDKYEMNFWEVPYAKGRLEVFGFKNGKPVEKRSVETTGPAKALKITPFKNTMNSDGWDVQPFKIEAVDDKGRTVPLAQNLVQFDVRGGEILGVGNGNPNSLESEKGNRRTLFNGLAQVIIRSNEGGNGALVLTASAEGLRPAKLSISTLPVTGPAWQKTDLPVQTLDIWYMAPRSTEKLQPSLTGNDSNPLTWELVRPGMLQEPDKNAGYSLCSSLFTPYSKVQKYGGFAEFDVTGACDIYIDKTLAMSKSGAERASVTLELPPFVGPRRLNVIFKSDAGAPFGFNAPVRVRIKP